MNKFIEVKEKVSGTKVKKEAVASFKKVISFKKDERLFKEA